MAGSRTLLVQIESFNRHPRARHQRLARAEGRMHGREHPQQHAGQRRVRAGLQHTQPDDDARHNIRRRTGSAHLTQAENHLSDEFKDDGYVKYVPMTFGGRKMPKFTVNHMYWTYKGKQFIYNLLKGDGILPLDEQENKGAEDHE